MSEAAKPAKQSLPAVVLELVERFERNRDSYKDPRYNETQLRREFLDPLFKGLEWDIDNEQGYAEAYKDVIHEDAIKVGEGTKAPDYCFRIGGARKFFLEAKKPAIDIKNDVAPAFQLRRYAWTTKLPLGILSDFEEFAVYDCRVKPHFSDKASVARILYIPYNEYAERWGEIAGVFSRDAVLKGSFDKYAESNKVKRGTADVDDEFLKTIEEWRSDLARNIALRNSKLTQRELNFAVQRIIDRIIFLRICEGRGLETYGRLQALGNGERIYPRLCQLFEEADARYNSGLFHFRPEKNRHEAPDELTLKLDIDDKLLRSIFKSIYYPESPYVFSALPAEILGQVYEQFLGKVIRLTEGHHAVVEEKPEVKKAGGVYYTPAYIVDYIVQNTVGKLIGEIDPKKLSPTQVLNRVSKLRALDPACGSGSFLLGAYEHLLKWHLNFYLDNDPGKWAKGAKPALVQASGGRYQLTIAERKRILLNNIYGVDIDAQAVETTKLSLLLKVLEGETQQTLQPVLRMFQERALPDLGDNIKCGNSLIGSDFYQQQSLNVLTEEEKYRINVFDWDGKDGFPEVMKDGGFDAVIGNPPYVRIQGFPNDQIKFFTGKFKSATGNCDLYVSFVERGLQLLGATGQFGMILPNKFLRTDYGVGLRTVLSTAGALRKLVDFGSEQVFEATTYTCLLFLSKKRNVSYIYGNSKATSEGLGAAQFQSKKSEALSGNPWIFENDNVVSIIGKLAIRSKRLLDLPASMSRGSSTGNDDVFMFEPGSGPKIERFAIRTPLFATDFGRYQFNLAGKWQVIFPYTLEGGKYRLLTEPELQERYPNTFKYLRENRGELEKRKQYAKWFGYSAPRNLELHDTAQIAVPLLANRGLFSLIPEPDRGKIAPMASGGFTVTLGPSCELKPEYVLGLMNSKLLFWRLGALSNLFRGGWITCTKQYVGELPIRTIDHGNPHDTQYYNSVISAVREIIDLHKRLAAAKTPQEKTTIERQVAATDAQIDKLVYELYGLTEEEIRIVEGKDAALSAKEETMPEEKVKPVGAFAAEPESAGPGITPEQAYGDAAHYFSAKEEPPPYKPS